MLKLMPPLYVKLRLKEVILKRLDKSVNEVKKDKAKERKKTQRLRDEGNEGTNFGR